MGKFSPVKIGGEGELKLEKAIKFFLLVSGFRGSSLVFLCFEGKRKNKRSFIDPLRSLGALIPCKQIEKEKDKNREKA